MPGGGPYGNGYVLASYKASDYRTVRSLTLPGKVSFAWNGLPQVMVGGVTTSNDLRLICFMDATVTEISDHCSLKKFPLEPQFPYRAYDYRLKNSTNPVPEVRYSGRDFTNLPTLDELIKFNDAP